MTTIYYILKIFLIAVYYILQAYLLVIALYCILTWFPKLRFTRFFGIIEKIVYPFMKIFSGRLVIGGFDLSVMLGFGIIQYLLGLYYRLILMF